MYYVVHALSQSDCRKIQKCWMSGPLDFCRDHVLFQNIFWDCMGHSELLLEVSRWFFRKRTFLKGVVLFSMGVVSFVDVIRSGPPDYHHQVVWCWVLELRFSSIVFRFLFFLFLFFWKMTFSLFLPLCQTDVRLLSNRFLLRDR